VESTRMVFGPGMSVWSIWLGIVLLMESRRATAPIQQGAFAYPSN